ncbi:hypothetical protein Vadar_026183 [Vaccinium darrowii]|uniref:Uncharacterized protein n=2 Tax=Vaccinium darrowii TaxID=229202 RepID=A0ACB7Y1N2_9ERIC|nr:hypothetical protein Vadar_018676 [Vaccinium darrowii]KAH7847449.1 hypothetical protein Vadar_026183 [Vaccinium darrowii]
MSWNVNGLRTLLKLEGFSALHLAQREDFDVLCLQETKLRFSSVSYSGILHLPPCVGQHEVLAPGPIKDLIAHREHRYRISGSSLLAAMDQNSQVPYADGLSVQPGNLSDDEEQTDRYANHSGKPHDVLDSLMHLTEVKQGGYCGSKSQILFLMQLVEYAAVLELLRIYLETRFYWGDIYWSAARNGTQ